MTELLHCALKEYELPNGWAISFPESWSHEIERHPEGDQYLFYPQNNDLTFRITSFRVENETGDAPIEVLRDVFSSSCSSLKKSKTTRIANNSFATECYIGVEKEGGQKIHRVSIGFIMEGFLLSVNIYATNRKIANQALGYANTICRV